MLPIPSTPSVDEDAQTDSSSLAVTIPSATALACVFFLTSFTQTLPVTAFGVWLNTTVKMPVSDQARYYAAMFVPWSMKPIFSIMSDYMPIRSSHRRSYMALACVGSSLAHLISAFGVTSVPGAFAAAIFRSMCEALGDCVLGLILIDLVHKDRSSAARMQANTTFARTAGSVAAYLAGLGLYGCGDDSSAWTMSSIIAFTAVFPLISALVSVLCLPDPEPLKTRPLTLPARWPRIMAGVGLVEFTIIWASVQNVVDPLVWLVLMSASGLACATMMLSTYFLGVLKGPVAAALFLFLLNAAPSPEDAWFSFSYSVLAHSQCAMQGLALLGEASGLLACLCFDSLVKKCGWRVEAYMVVLVVLASLASLLNVALVESRGGDAPVAAFAAVTVVLGFVSRLAFLAQQTFATEKCYSAGNVITPGVMYGVYLSFLDFGDSASAWLSAPLIAAYGIDYVSQNWSGLSPLIAMNVVIQVFIVLASAVLFFHRGPVVEAGYERVEDNGLPLV